MDDDVNTGYCIQQTVTELQREDMGWQGAGFAKCGPQTRASVTWELATTADSWGLEQLIRKLWGWGWQSVLTGLTTLQFETYCGRGR